MKIKNSYFYTLREDSKDEDSISGNLLVRSGMIKKSSNGIYMFLPLGLKVLNKIINIIREEMNNIGAQELSMPALISRDIYEASGRASSFGSSIFSLKDRFNRDYILGPTHEELFTIASLSKIRSYKDMPYSLYQFQTKFRDEPRPRYGLIRVREFIMKDAYSFDKDLDGLDISYNKMFNAYKKSFDRMKLDYKIVKADTGVMGGILSEEFQAVTDIGEDTLVLCDSCDFSSNIEITPCIYENNNSDLEKLTQEIVYTPDMKTIEDVCAYLNVDIKNSVKALMFKANDKLVICFIPGMREVNETKLMKIIDAKEIEMADEEFITAHSNAIPGFTGPSELTYDENVKLLFDSSVLKLKNALIGANKKDYHIKNFDMTAIENNAIKADICCVIEGDICPKCGKKLIFKKGIEIGNTFKLGTKYSEALGLNYLDQNNKSNPVVMGSYGIGPARCMAAIIEQNHDDKGMIWPINVAPYHVCIIVANSNDKEQNELALKIYEDLNANHIDVILDDRDERLGVKLNDMDLIGIPIRILVGKRAFEQIVEVKHRSDTLIKEMHVDEILNHIESIIE